jgi:hypothetical protein
LTSKPRIDGLWIFGIVFGLVIPMPFTLLYSAFAVCYAAPAMFVAEATFQERLLGAAFLLWLSAGWMGLGSIFSILKRSDYSSRALNLWQISGLISGIVAAAPWLAIGFEAVVQTGTVGLFDLLVLCLAGPTIVAVVCLIKLKGKNRETKAETSQPSPVNGT